MYLSLNIILEMIGLDPVEHGIREDMPKFRAVEFYTPKEPAASADVLYVSTLSTVLTIPKNEDLWFLVVRDRMHDDSETPEAMKNIIVIQKNIDVVLLVNKINRVFSKFYKWNLEMERSLFNNEGLQKLLDLSEDILGNFIIIHDGSFKSRGYTAGIAIDDEVVERLIINGYHPAETLKLFSQKGRMDEFERETGITVNDDYSTSKYIVVKKIFHTHNAIAMFVVMFCNHRNPSPALLEMFQMLLDNIKYYIERDYDDGKFSATKALLTDLMKGKPINSTELSSRAQYVNLPTEGYFKLCVCSFDANYTLPIRRLMYALSSAFPSNVVFAMENQILVLIQSVTPLEEEAWISTIKAHVDSAHTFMLPFNYLCGISNTFTTLEDCPIALEQAQKAIMTAKCFRKKNEHVFSFESTVVYSLLLSEIRTYKRLYSNSFITTVLPRIREYDAEHSTNLYELLFFYLTNECKVSAVSSLMHMHRNTVLYHLEKLENYLGVSFNDFSTRLTVTLAYMLDSIE